MNRFLFAGCIQEIIPGAPSESGAITPRIPQQTCQEKTVRSDVMVLFANEYVSFRRICVGDVRWRTERKWGNRSANSTANLPRKNIWSDVSYLGDDTLSGISRRNQFKFLKARSFSCILFFEYMNMYTYMYTYVPIYICIYVSISAYLRICIHTYPCIYAYMCTYVRIYV